ncbi:uncharacterized protein L3040_006204 [Drepanopeziza brunnea f. sp. 'multigermtubi']|uniref:uncharacterized protein n=1 Tax=Drepanopeziza brunnea f. sp. 'multigermtubi' TaxID=698441 RepID=UPI0023986173|nr:hypothetical protein L3040_006204 [Drepanopeziza brunnea f. sp. 'multigermtubi']
MSDPEPANAAHKGPRALGDLPDELLIQVMNLLPTQHDLGSVCLVSRRMNSIADPVLYKSILFDKPKHHLLFSESLVTRPRRGSLIQNVRVDFASAEMKDLLCLTDMPHPIDRFSHTISTMSNLEDLVISVPDSLSHGIGNLFNGPFDLACLKTCSLFYQREDGGYWDLQENIHIFGHPTLEHLTIRHAKLDERGFESLEKPWYTGLKALFLLECDIHDDALADLLVLPEALEEITITQLEDPEPALEESPEYMEDYILACRSAQHSLQRITIDFPTLAAKNPLKLRDFELLKELKLRDHQLFGMKTPRLFSVALPQNLEVLEFLSEVGTDEEVAELLCYTIENKAILARKWTDLVVVEGKGVPDRIKEVCGPFEEFLQMK